jgi:hypothetical protein
MTCIKIFQLVITHTTKSDGSQLKSYFEFERFSFVYAAYEANVVPSLDRAGQVLFDLMSADSRHNRLGTPFQGVFNPTILTNLIFNTSGKKLQIFFSNNFNQCLESTLI